MRQLIQALVRGEAGTTAIEYSLIGTLVGVAIIVALQNFSGVTNVLYAVITSMTTYL